VKIELVHRLQDAGLKEIEVTSFVSPKWVPQMADNAEVMAASSRQPGVRYSVLTPNMKGFEAAPRLPSPTRSWCSARPARPSASATSTAPSPRASSASRPWCAARENGIYVRGAMSCTVGCPYEGEIDPRAWSMVARLMKGIGVQHIGVADTIGVGTPRKVQRALEAALKHYGMDDISGHFHDTYGQALVNTWPAWKWACGSSTPRSAGLGGCPYAKGATGNVATEDVVYMLHGMGIDTGIDLDKLIDAGKYISDFLGRKPNSRASNRPVRARCSA
jgi:hydroxymethylglutaryl-CoA lyase